MSSQNDPIDYEELILSNTVSTSAFVAFLERKGIATKDEVLAEVDRIMRDMDSKVWDNRCVGSSFHYRNDDGS